jgi:hypothetical protein
VVALVIAMIIAIATVLIGAVFGLYQLETFRLRGRHF